MHDHPSDLLPWYDSGRLSADQQALIAAHIADCAECRETLAQWRAIGGAVRRQYQQMQTIQSTRDPNSPPDVAWLQQFNSPKGQHHMKTMPAKLPQSGRRQGIVGVAAAMLLALLILFSWFISRPPTFPGSGREISLLPKIGGLEHIVMVSSTEGWAIGFLDNYPPTATPGVNYDPAVVLHYTGYWQVDTTIPALIAPDDNRIVHYNNIAMDSPNDGWIVGSIQPAANQTGQTQGFMLHYTQGSWIQVANTFPILTCITMVSANEGWAAGAGVVLHYASGAWEPIANPMAPAIACASMSAIAANGVWIASGAPSTIFHYDGQSWATEHNDVANAALGDIWMTSPNEGWAVGGHYSSSQGALIEHYSNGVWQSQFTGGSTPQGPGYFFGLAMISNAEGWAVGFGGIIAHYQHGHWSQISSPTTHGLLSVSMISSTEGWACGDENGVLVRYMDGEWSIYQR